MSLDVYLIDPTSTYDTRELFWANITHNLSKMAAVAGIYEALWRPEEIGATKAEDIINVIEGGLNEMKQNPEKYKKYNPPNGWGKYEDFIVWVEKYLEALKEYPESTLKIST